MYEREEHYSKVTPDGTTETWIVKEKSGSGFVEFLGAIAFITMCIISVTLLCNALHPQTQTIIIQLEKPSN